MAECDFKVMSLNELKKLQEDVTKAISTNQDRQKAEARSCLAELVGTEMKTARVPAAAKYRHR